MMTKISGNSASDDNDFWGFVRANARISAGGNKDY